MESIYVRHLYCHYGKKEVIHDFSFSQNEKECVALIGKNGCGKTTLLQVLAGIKKADKGEILLYDKKANHKSVNALVGYVPQENMLIEECTVLDNLRLWYKDYEVLKSDMESVFFGEFGIKDMLHQHCNKLSGGMKKKVSIACALANAPKILILDEPCQALDLDSKRKLRQFLSEYANKGNTVLMATHEEADFAICDHIISLDSTERFG